jgi:SAM-dependent methyltransferase
MSDEKQVTRAGITYAYSSAWIHQLESEQQWRLYWQQQAILQPHLAPGDTILEMGHGTGFTANYLRSHGYTVTTVDIDPEKQPDIVANLPDFELEAPVDHVLGFEVFEHVPFEDVQGFVERVAPQCRKGFYLSVPRCERPLLRLEGRLPKLGPINWAINRKKPRITTAHHFWELNDGRIDESAVSELFSPHGFTLAERVDRFCRAFFAFTR